eukprot:8753128-Alexandrium_andersonii.AAC.1
MLSSVSKSPSGPPWRANQPRSGGPPREDQAASCPPAAKWHARWSAARRSRTTSSLQHSKKRWRFDWCRGKEG